MSRHALLVLLFLLGLPLKGQGPTERGSVLINGEFSIASTKLSGNPILGGEVQKQTTMFNIGVAYFLFKGLAAGLVTEWSANNYETGWYYESYKGSESNLNLGPLVRYHFPFPFERVSPFAEFKYTVLSGKLNGETHRGSEDTFKSEIGKGGSTFQIDLGLDWFVTRNVALETYAGYHLATRYDLMGDEKEHVNKIKDKTRAAGIRLAIFLY